ncbi:hypothetical protein [Myxococcus vastator]|uniref:hypothetical protein n=1 Tax=Myxococcus vastator TaxID=2709664 RepID=UPI0013D3688B|nr:hypothetical protein [Myxococcus vastator]
MNSPNRTRQNPDWVDICGLMLLRHLDPLNSVEALVIAYRITDRPNDLWTERFNAFKSGDPRAIQGACRVLSQALKNIRFIVGPVILTAAIPSKFRVLPVASPIYLLGSFIAKALGWTWRPEILRKRPHRQLHLMYNSARRDAEVEGVYRCTVRGLEGTVLVLDDFITRGSTIREIARAIRQGNPAVNVVGLALGKTERVAHWEAGGINNGHVPEELAQVWDSNDLELV